MPRGWTVPIGKRKSHYVWYKSPLCGALCGNIKVLPSQPKNACARCLFLKKYKQLRWRKDKRKGKTFEEIYGKKRGKELKEKLSQSKRRIRKLAKRGLSAKLTTMRSVSHSPESTQLPRQTTKPVGAGLSPVPVGVKR